ncbi:hydroxyacylglutathione hydrolase [Candidatus Berkiella aquae]|uniref:Hydroxyacylglutathione hydrolase n=1 Tax=Candidatus Berkiella aquae TaxID=295108 RepID=A0A0Q9YII3_9GAMM|nr:hydroxyacylglutathione hydrolase [Candidatus Berkiella aquae]MCS5711708.1 hydroxyacylglutathione hydrolase [Candidatus Berkiella aquae]
MNNIIAIPAFKDNYIWAIHSLEGNKIIVVDPGDASPVLDYLQANKLSLHAILITHHHFDHSGGIKALQAQFPNIAVYGSKNEFTEGVTSTIEEGSQLYFPEFNLTLNVLDIPGHTKGHIAYYNEEILFCGDTLFSCGCGKIFEGTPSQMLQSLEKLKQLSAETMMYCGHEYTKANIAFAQTVDPTNAALAQRLAEVLKCEAQGRPTLPTKLKNEFACNPFLRVNTQEIILAVQKHWNFEAIDPVTLFSHLREWKNQF